MPKLKGYPVPSGYKGQLLDGTWQIFDTEGEYINYILEEERDNDGSRSVKKVRRKERKDRC